MSQFNLLDLRDKPGAGVCKLMHSVVCFHPTCRPAVNMDFPLIIRNGPPGTILCHCIFYISYVPIFLHLLLSFHLIFCLYCQWDNNLHTWSFILAVILNQYALLLMLSHIESVTQSCHITFRWAARHIYFQTCSQSYFLTCSLALIHYRQHLSSSISWRELWFVELLHQTLFYSYISQAFVNYRLLYFYIFEGNKQRDCLLWIPSVLVTWACLWDHRICLLVAISKSALAS